MDRIPWETSVQPGSLLTLGINFCPHQPECPSRIAAVATREFPAPPLLSRSPTNGPPTRCPDDPTDLDRRHIRRFLPPPSSPPHIHSPQLGGDQRRAKPAQLKKKAACVRQSHAARRTSLSKRGHFLH